MANDFSGDPHCCALWRFESGVMTADSKGGNTLTAGGHPNESAVCKEGTCAADFVVADGDHMFIADADTDSGFPLKKGDTTKKFSICAWFKIDSIAANRAPFAKWDSSLNQRTIIPLRTGSTSWQSFIGYNLGKNAETLYDGGTPQTGRWYHYGFTFDDSDKSWKLVIWDDGASPPAKVVNTGGTATNNIYVEAARNLVGAGYETAGSVQAIWDGLIDEMVVFNDILTTDEIDAIRSGTYVAPEAGKFWPAIFGLLSQQG